MTVESSAHFIIRFIDIYIFMSDVIKNEELIEGFLSMLTQRQIYESPQGCKARLLHPSPTEPNWRSQLQRPFV